MTRSALSESNTPQLLANKVILVTGAGRGLGRAHALYFSELGATVILIDSGVGLDGTQPDPSVVADTARLIRAKRRTVFDYAVDLTDAKALEDTLRDALSQTGQLDGVVHCAGIARPGALQNLSQDDVEAQVAIDLKATIKLAQLCSDHMRVRRAGSLLFCTSPSFAQGVIHQALQQACASSVIGLTRSLAVELARYQIRVNALAATAKTRMTEQLPLFKDGKADTLSVERVAPVSAFLMSDLSTHISGEVIGVAGARVFTFAFRETPGHYFEESSDAATIANEWRSIQALR